jgi:hypothetical protein
MVCFREAQRFRQPWLWTILSVPALLSAFAVYRQVIVGRPWGDLALSNMALIRVSAFFLLILLWVYEIRFVTEVRQDHLSIQFVLMWRRRTIPLAEIRSVQVVTYNPVADYGGWGIRKGRRGWAYTVSGNRGVELELSTGERLLIGSQRPDELALAIGTMRG